MPFLEHTRQSAKSRYQHLSALSRQTKADILLGLIFSLTAALYALLMVCDRAPTLGLIGMGGLWLLHWVMVGWERTPMDVPILGLLVLLPLSSAISIDRSLTLPKVHGLILGIALFYVVVNAVRTPKRLSLASYALLLLAIGVSILGLIGTDWYEDKLFELPAPYSALPRLVKDVPRSISGGGIHFNLMAGALVFFLPGGLLAHQVFGIMDAFMLGTKLGAILWLYFGLVAAVFLHGDPHSSPTLPNRPLKVRSDPWQNGKRHLIQLVVGLAEWLILSLFAIAFVNLSVILSIIISILSGVLLGMDLTVRLEQSDTVPDTDD